MARLEIVGDVSRARRRQDGKPAVNILHVFGRTYGEPRVYYYRQWVNREYWTAWERVDLDIEGDHLMTVVWKRRLYLLWPIITETAEPLEVEIPKDGGTINSQPKKFWQIKLAWSERRSRESGQKRKYQSNRLMILKKRLMTQDISE